MRNDKIFSALYVRKYHELPFLPQGLRHVKLMPGEQSDSPSIMPAEYDIWLLEEAVADFRSGGVKLILPHSPKAIYWIKDAHNIYGINGRSKLRLNHLYCIDCKDNVRTKKVINTDIITGERTIAYICPKKHQTIFVIIPPRNCFSRKPRAKNCKPKYKNRNGRHCPLLKKD